MGCKNSKSCCYGLFQKFKSEKKPSQDITSSTREKTHRTSSEILRELKEIGIINSTAKNGNVQFFIPTSDSLSEKTQTQRQPRRLPSLKTKNHTEDTIYNKDEKDLMTEIRRIGALADKGYMARLHQQRRREVLRRKEDKMRRKLETEKGYDKSKTKNTTLPDVST